MAKNIIHYIEEYGRYTFKEEEFNEVDSLILCQLSYLRYDGVVPSLYENRRSVSLRSLMESEKYDDLFKDDLYEKDNRELFQKLAKCERFSDLRLNFYINIVEKEWETQFSAITFLLRDGTFYVAYRGTDVTIIGWKEDFNMAFLDPVPGQEYSKKYLNIVAGKAKNSLYVGGHSKGGNLAVYASMTCMENVRKRIIKVYSMDGPGFRPEVLQRCAYSDIRKRIVKILPQSSLVGMLFERDRNYRVVDSNSFGLLQHNPYTWLVKENHFIYEKKVYEGRKLMDDTISEWALGLDPKHAELFVDTLYQVVAATEAENILQIVANWKKSMERMKEAMKDLDEETEKMLKQTIKSLFQLFRLRMRKSTERGEHHLKGVRDATAHPKLEENHEGFLQ